MPGLLSPEMLDVDPRTQALMATGMAMLANSGPSRMPIPFGAIAGKAGLEGLGAYNGAMETLRRHAQTQALIDLEKQKGDLLKVQVESAARKEKLANDILAAWAARLRGASPLAPQSAPAVTPPGMSEGTSMLAFGSPEFATRPTPASSGSPLAPNGAGFRISPEDAFMLKMGGIGDFSELAKFTNTPQEMKGGSFYEDPVTRQRQFVPDPSRGIGFQDGRVTELPGADVLARLEARAAGAKKSAEAPYIPPSVIQTPQGARLMTVPQQIEYATGAPTQPTLPPPSPAPAPFPKETPPQRQAAAQRALAVLERERDQQIAAAGSADAELLRTIERTRKMIPATPRAGPGAAVQSDTEKAFEGKYGGELGGIAADLLKTGDASRNRLQIINSARLALEGIKAAGGSTGRQAPMVQAATEWAQGVKIDPAKLGLPKDAGPYQLLDAALNRMAMGMIGPGGIPANNFSEADRNFAVSTVGRKVDTEAGIQAKLYVAEKAEQRNLEAERSWLAAREEGKTFEEWRRAWGDHVERTPLLSDSEKRNVLLKLGGGREARGIILRPPSRNDSALMDALSKYPPRVQ